MMDQDIRHIEEEIKEETQKLTGYPSIDKPWLKYYDCKFSEADIPNMSIYQLAFEYNKDNLDNVALDIRSSVTDYSKGIKITYKKFFERIRETAKASFVLGIRKDDIIPIILPNIPEARILIYANRFLVLCHIRFRHCSRQIS